jgi:hypothetical protein
MSPTYTSDAACGFPFRVRLVRRGERHGAEMCLTHSQDEPLVEFYDTRYPHTYDFVGAKEAAIAANAPVLGQYIASYRLSTLRESRHLHAGLCLHGGVPGWLISPSSLANVHDWLDTVAPTTPAIIQGA